MPRRMMVLPLVALVAVVAGIGLLLGGRAVTTTETDVIERIAARYLDEAGEDAQRSDCSARPAASDDLWLVVTCGHHEYFVDAYGRLAHTNGPGSTS
ncbi:hypothetical protein ACROSR_05255 [Roseovarius tibetensis]|uniref:hypothetical protein n=1 Tax=Roseovarius tibetensis TaxID=2685897 RepID=UPI003D7FA2B8